LRELSGKIKKVLISLIVPVKKRVWQITSKKWWQARNIKVVIFHIFETFGGFLVKGREVKEKGEKTSTRSDEKVTRDVKFSGHG
jgi:hypothetical protein